MLIVAGLLHPTTAAFFVVFLISAIWVTDRRRDGRSARCHAHSRRRGVDAAGRSAGRRLDANGRRVASVARVQGLPIPSQRLERWCVAREPRHGSACRRNARLSCDSRHRTPARGGVARRSERAAGRVPGHPAASQRGMGVLRAAADFPRLLDPRPAGHRRGDLVGPRSAVALWFGAAPGAGAGSCGTARGDFAWARSMAGHRDACRAPARLADVCPTTTGRR